MTSHINEDRRKTEGQMQMFEMLREIEDCPVSKRNTSFVPINIHVSTKYLQYMCMYK